MGWRNAAKGKCPKKNDEIVVFKKKKEKKW